MKAFPVTALFLALLVAASHHDGVMSAAAADAKVTIDLANLSAFSVLARSSSQRDGSRG